MEQRHARRRLGRLDGEATVELHPAMPNGSGSRAAQWFRLRSRRGEIRVCARLTAELMPGTVFMPFHFAEATANLLTNAAQDPVAKIPEYKVCAVVEPVGDANHSTRPGRHVPPRSPSPPDPLRPQ